VKKDPAALRGESLLLHMRGKNKKGKGFSLTINLDRIALSLGRGHWGKFLLGDSKGLSRHKSRGKDIRADQRKRLLPKKQLRLGERGKLDVIVGYGSDRSRLLGQQGFDSIMLGSKVFHTTKGGAPDVGKCILRPFSSRR